MAEVTVDPAVTFDSSGCRLAGTLVSPAGPRAAALLLSGSGRVDRDSDTRGLRLGVTRILADELARARVATLRYDKRGVGASGGDYLRAGFHEQLADARAALRRLTERMPGLPVLVVGHSEGGLHAIELAADSAVAAAVLLGTPARPGAEVLRWQAEQILDTMPRWARALLRAVRLDPLETQRRRLARIAASSRDVMRIQGVRVNARWLRELIAHDPRPTLRRITVPVLAITGAHDVQVPPADIDMMRELIPGPFEGHVVAGVNHLLRPDPHRRGPRGCRRSARDPLAPAVLELITDWVSRTVPVP